MRGLSSAALISILIGIAPDAWAQAGGIALNQLEPAPAGDAFFGVPGPSAAGHLVPRAFLMFDYAHEPLRILNAPDEAAVVASQGFLRLDASLSLWDRVLVSIDMPFAVLQSGEEPSGGASFNVPTSAELGDLRIGARVRLLGEAPDALQIGIGSYFFAPTGASGSYAGDGAARGGFHASLGGHVEAPLRLVWGASGGALFHGSGNPHGFAFGGGLAALFLDDKVQIGPELFGSTAFGGRSALPITGASIHVDSSTGAEILLGAKVRAFSGLVIGAAGGPGLSTAIGTPAFRVIAQVAWSPALDEPKEVAIGDKDDDGIRDDVDACPSVKGDLSGDPSKDGCPREDRDGDAVLDIDDACPNDPGERRSEVTKNGCPPDADEDGIADKADACPSRKGIPSVNAAKNGCPEDRDSDGVEDVADACPEKKGIASRDAKRNGCPDDEDGDGVKDPGDACPREKGVADADPRLSGCPKFVRVTPVEIAVLKQVQFRSYGRHKSETVDPVSDDLLREVRDIINQHQEILRIEVQGHTDDSGDPEFNLRLSQERADSVRRWLIDAGIPAAKLTSKGYGHSVPIADNRIAEGRQKNRRVQFVILDRKK